MFYAIDEKLMARLKAFVASDEPGEQSERNVLLQELSTSETDPILSSLLWTKMDLLAECRRLIQGTNPRDSAGTVFEKTAAFVDPIRERLAMETTRNVDEFCLGNRNDIDTDIGCKVAEMLRNAVIKALGNTGIDEYDTSVPLADLLVDYFTHRQHHIQDLLG